VQSMPPNLLYGVYPHGGVPPGDDQPIGVTVAGAVRCRGSGEDLRRDGLLARLGHLLDVEQWGYVGVTPGENWAFTIGREVRRFRAVTDVTDYLGRRSPRTPATARPAPPFPTTPLSPATSGARCSWFTATTTTRAGMSPRCPAARQRRRARRRRHRAPLRRRRAGLHLLPATAVAQLVAGSTSVGQAPKASSKCDARLTSSELTVPSVPSRDACDRRGNAGEGRRRAAVHRRRCGAPGDPRGRGDGDRAREPVLPLLLCTSDARQRRAASSVNYRCCLSATPRGYGAAGVARSRPLTRYFPTFVAAAAAWRDWLA
jgi:hypothetical protein